MSRIAKITALLILGMIPAGCSTVKMPDLVDLPEFKEAGVDTQNLEFPDPMKAPSLPDDLRTAAQWDQAAGQMVRQRDNFGAPEDIGGRTEQQIKQDIEALRNKVKEYKLDDPVE